MATVKTLYRKEKKFFESNEYVLSYWDDFNYDVFDHVLIRQKSNKQKTKYADLIIMADTETSKKKDHVKKDNHICAWSVAFRACEVNICTLWGQNPWDFIECINRVRKHLKCEEVYIYFHNLPYDWVFLRKFIIDKWGKPEKYLNIKPLYPLFLRFSNGIILKDSLALAQRKLEKWAEDLSVDTKKAVGYWDYNKYRNQSDELSELEKIYIEHDVLAGVECIDKTLKALKKTIASIPYTATGIVRTECRNIGRSHKAHDWFLRLQPEDYHFQQILELLFNGGYTHANEFICGERYPAICFDESSAYPFVSITEKFPSEKFWKLNRKVDEKYILQNKEEYAFVFKCKIKDVELIDKYNPMPFLSRAKAQVCLKPIMDNGRVRYTSYCEIYFNEIDLELFLYQYNYSSIEFEDVYVSLKDYLPRWLTDYIFDRYKAKTMLKGVDGVLYQIEKGKLNACAFGMLAQRPIKETIEEAYETFTDSKNVIHKQGEFYINEDFDPDKEYKKYLNNKNSFLPYIIAPWITSAARRNLFSVASCVDVENGGIHLYSDTDSVYATKFNMKKVEKYNNMCIRKLEERGYGGVEFKGKMYYLGVLENDGEYMDFKTLHSKCYCKRPLTAVGDNFVMGEDLKLTVAGVPKKGVKSLKNNINNFKVGFCFDGETSGKLKHKHITVDHIYTDRDGNITGDSIDLEPCEYIVGEAEWTPLTKWEDVEVQVYEE